VAELVPILFVIFAVLAAVILIKTVRIVPQASVFVIERLGKYSRTLEPGIHLLVPVIDRVRTRTDIREQVVGFPPQAVITRDNLVVGIDSVIYYSITDPAAAQYKIENVVTAIEQLVVTTLRNVVGGMQLEEALTGRDHINERLAAVLDEATGKWGVKVNRVEIRGIEPPPTIRDAMEQAMRADRGKRAAILTAQGQRTATILKAEADRESALLRAQGEAQAIAMVVAAIKSAGVDDTVLAFQRQQLLPRIAEGDANKVWFVPTDIAGMLGQLGVGRTGSQPEQQPQLQQPQQPQQPQLAPPRQQQLPPQAQATQPQPQQQP
jgi:regulator of protease activity HflC (stomatin/prohibitin superfamily)